MATKQQLVEWLETNADKRGTPDYETVKQSLQSQIKIARDAEPQGAARAAVSGGAQGLIESVPPTPLPHTLLMGLGSQMLPDEAFGYNLAPVKRVMGATSGADVWGKGKQAVQDKMREMGVIRDPQGTGEEMAYTAGRIGAPGIVGGAAGLARGGGRALLTELGGMTIPPAAGVAAEQAGMDPDLAAMAVAPLSGLPGAAATATGRKMAGRTPTQAQRKVEEVTKGVDIEQRLDDLGPGATIASTTPAAQRLARVTAQSDPVRQQDATALTNLVHIGQARRITKPLREQILAGRGSYADTVEELAEMRQRTSAPLWDKVNKADFEPSDRMLQMIKGTRQGMKAWSDVRDIAASKSGGTRILPQEPTKEMRKFSDWQVVKEALDDVVDSHLDAVTGRVKPGESGKLDAAIKLRDGFRDEIDNLVPDYKPARDVWAGYTAPEKALSRGRKYWTMDERTYRAITKNMDDSEREWFRMGAVQALEDQLDSARDFADVTAKFNTTRMRKQVAELLGEEAPTDTEMSRRTFLKGTAGLGASAVLARSGLNLGEILPSGVPRPSPSADWTINPEGKGFRFMPHTDTGLADASEMGINPKVGMLYDEGEAREMLEQLESHGSMFDLSGVPINETYGPFDPMSVDLNLPPKHPLDQKGVTGFLDNLEREATLAETRRAVQGGSPTAANQQIAATASQSTAREAAASLATGDVRQAGRGAVRRTMEAITGSSDDKVLGDINTILMTRDPLLRETLLKDLRRSMEGKTPRMSLGAGATGLSAMQRAMGEGR